jgi:hypothetical protein
MRVFGCKEFFKVQVLLCLFVVAGCLSDDDSTDNEGGTAGLSGQGGEGGASNGCDPSACGQSTADERICADGQTVARRECREDEDATCVWIDECPEDVPCTPDECGEAPGAPQELCSDGETWGGPGPCTRFADWSCGYPNVQCPDPETCEPGSSFGADDGCNTCACPESGLVAEAACTEIACGPEPETCEPGSSFEADDGCNTCACPESGLVAEAACTEIACGPEPETCEPGSSFEADDGCNTCQCPESGLKAEAACTRIACQPEPETCEPGSSFDADDGCNTCQCPESGLKAEAACTRIACEPNPETCEPGSSIPAGDGCNTCQCPESGLTREADACTEAFCSGTCSGDTDCLDTQFCDFEYDDCGFSGRDGRCAGRPTTCVAGGIGACGCDGSARTNTCELNGTGVDSFRFGGCSFDDTAAFVCGDMSCNAESDFCAISFNDVFGENEPEYFSNCRPLPDRCRQGDCDCLNLQSGPGEPTCFDGPGKTFLFYPGG